MRESTEANTPGEIITFYSYKGGTGRSMMLANVAWILASNGRRVLAVDWDLEAPGLHRYFEPFITDRHLTRSEGVIDLVNDFATEALTPTNDEAGSDWFRPLADIRRYAFALDFDFPTGGVLHFVPAGRQGPSYATRVNAFDWTQFYERFGGGSFLDAVKATMREHYDYVLIDSRTGVSDTSGICTVQMPDTLVTCFTLNNQGIDGASAVARSVLSQRADNPVRVLPVPMRVDNSEKLKLDARLAYARGQLAGMPDDLSARSMDTYWSDVEVPYVPWFSYEEALATFADRPGRAHTTLAAAENLTAHLTDHRIVALVPPSEVERERVLAAYDSRAAVVTRRFDLFLSDDSSTAAAAEQLADTLDEYGVRTWLASRLIPIGAELATEARNAMLASGSCAVLVGPEGVTARQAVDLENAAERSVSDPTFRYFAVLVPGVDSRELPTALRRRQWVDLRSGITDPEGLAGLLRAVNAPARSKRSGSGGSARLVRMRMSACRANLDSIDGVARSFKDVARELGVPADGMVSVEHALADAQFDAERSFRLAEREVDGLTGDAFEDAITTRMGVLLDDLSQRTKQVKDRHLDVLGRLLVRRSDGDGGLCRLADELLAEFAVLMGSTPPISLPLSRGAVPSRADGPIISVDSDWTVWHLPLVAHDHAHQLLETRWFRDSMEELTVHFETGQFQRYRLTEFVADALATWMAGPAYAAAVLFEKLWPVERGNPLTGEVAGRIRIIMATLQLMSDLNAGLRDFAERIRAASDEFVAGQADTARSSTEMDVDALARQIEALVQTQVVRRVPTGACVPDRSLVEFFESAGRETRTAGVAAAEPSMLRVFSSAWFVRLGGSARGDEELGRSLRSVADRTLEQSRFTTRTMYPHRR